MSAIERGEGINSPYLVGPPRRAAREVVLPGDTSRWGDSPFS